MSSVPLPQWHSLTKSSHGRKFCCRIGLFPFNNIPGIGILFGSFFVGLILYITFLSPHSPLLLSSSKWFTPTNHISSSPSDGLSLEQIRTIVAPTRGFLARDYSLNLGWNNVSIRDNLI